MRALRGLACSVALLAAGQAAAYSELVVFGDSLSDPGNFYALAGTSFPAVPFPLYSSGRFSNGKVAAEYLGDKLGLNAAQVHNFAWGGAMTGTDNYSKYDPGMQGFLSLPGNETLKAKFAGAEQTGLMSQFGGYLTSTGGVADPNALYMVWGGPNDFATMQALGVNDPAQMGAYVQGAAANIATITGGLLAAGARHILIPNMADLGMTPGVQAGGPAAVGGAHALSVGFNQTLDAYLDGMTAMNPLAGDALIRFDTFSYLSQQAANPALGGFSNVSQQCVMDPACASNPNANYLFWDFQHPTSYGHQVLAGAFFAAAVPEPSTWSAMTAGLMVLGIAIRRRRG